MNSDFNLCDFVESDRKTMKPTGLPAKNSRSMNQELELLIATTYNEVMQILEEAQSDVTLPEGAVKTPEKVILLKRVIEHLLSNEEKQPGKNPNETNAINCIDCQNYETNLQKLENEVRQHIRLEQQLKIYHETIEEKVEDLKKEKKELEKKNETQRKQIEVNNVSMKESRNQGHGVTERHSKLQYENEKLKAELKQFKHAPLDKHAPLVDKKAARSSTPYEKENKMDWMHRQTYMKGDKERKSVEKRSDSSERYRMQANCRSVKGIAISDKAIQEKSREDKRKAIQTKFQYRK